MSHHVLVLFSGTGSVEDALHDEYGDKVAFISCDNNPMFSPTHLCDVQVFPYKSYPPGYFHAVWASPPCTEYSVAKTVGVRDYESADANVVTALTIIDYLKPQFFFIENPRGHLRLRPFMKPLEPYMRLCTYCMYGTPFRKPTNIWTNAPLPTPLKVCTKKLPCHFVTPDGRHPATAQSGCHKRNGVSTDVGTPRHHAYRIPKDLVLHLFSIILHSENDLQDGPEPLLRQTGHEISLQTVKEGGGGGEGDDGILQDGVCEV